MKSEVCFLDDSAIVEHLRFELRTPCSQSMYPTVGLVLGSGGRIRTCKYLGQSQAA